MNCVVEACVSKAVIRERAQPSYRGAVRYGAILLPVCERHEGLAHALNVAREDHDNLRIRIEAIERDIERKAAERSAVEETLANALTDESPGTEEGEGHG